MLTSRDHTCGDTCYLSIVDARGKQHEEFCAAPLCQAWNGVSESRDSLMPDRFAGRKVRVTVTKGRQVIAKGPETRPFPPFSKIEFLR